MCAVAEVLAGRSDREPTGRDDGVAAHAVADERVAAGVVQVAVVLDGDLQLRVCEVDTREEPTGRVADLVLGDRRRQTVSFKQQEHEAFGFTLGARIARGMGLEHGTKPSGPASASTAETVVRSAELAHRGEFSSQRALERDVERGRPDQRREIEQRSSDGRDRYAVTYGHVLGVQQQGLVHDQPGFARALPTSACDLDPVAVRTG
jgi:hypothetical protein